MKTTAQRLSEVYCRPKTDEWRHFEKLSDDDDIVIKWGGEVITTTLKNLGSISKRKSEIPVTHFIDLLQDKIASWRLEEDGILGWTYIRRGDGSIKWEVWVTDGYAELNGKELNITTYTGLLMLIKLIA